MLPVVEFALNNAVHASTGYTPFYVNGLTHLRVPLKLPRLGSKLGRGEIADRLANVSPSTVRKQVSEFIATRFNVLRHVRDAMAESQDKQKETADAKSRGCIERYEVGDQVLLNAKNLPTKVVSAVFKTKLRPRYIGPFTVVAKKGLAYTLNLPRKLRTHPVFYVGLLKPYRDPSHVDWKALAPKRLESRLVKGTSIARPADHPNVSDPGPGIGDGSPCDLIAHATQAPRALTHRNGGECQRKLSPINRPPPVLLDEQGNQQFHVEKLLQRRRRDGQYQYLVKWRGHPESENSWEYEIPLRQDCPFAFRASKTGSAGEAGRFILNGVGVLGSVSML